MSMRLFSFIKLKIPINGDHVVRNMEAIEFAVKRILENINQKMNF